MKHAGTFMEGKVRRRALIIVALGLLSSMTMVLGQWGVAKRLTWTAGDSYNPAIAIDSNNAIHVVWHDYAPGNPAIYYRRSIDGGLTWAAVRRLTWNSGPALYAAIARGMGDESRRLGG